MDLTTFSSLRACRTLKTVVKRKFLSSPIDPYVTSDVSDAQNCGKTQIFELAERPFRHFERVGRPKLWQNANSGSGRATLSSLRTCQTLKTVVKWTFLTGLNRTTVENCDKMDVVVVLWWCFGGVVVWWCFCGGVVFLWWCFCGGVVFLWWCFCGVVVVFLWWCGGVLVVVFLWWCGVFVVVFLWWCFCGGVFVVLWWCFCGVVVVFLWWCGGVLAVVFLWWCSCGGVFVVVFLWWCSCGGVFVVLWCSTGVVLEWCFCGGVFLVMFLW